MLFTSPNEAALLVSFLTALLSLAGFMRWRSLNLKRTREGLQLEIKHVIVYPIKSCRGVYVDCAEVGKGGEWLACH